MGSPDIASRRWIWEQYDHMVGADTVQRPGGDAAVVRVHGTQKGLAITTDCTPRYCFADPKEGGKQAIAEAWRNLTAVGATPLAVTNCLNFANPQRPEIMGQIVGCLEGMSEACIALDFPIVSGNVSLYNESKATGGGSAILPTPAIGGLGLLADYTKSATIAFKAEGEGVFVIGPRKRGHLGQSLWLREVCGREDGPPPPVDLAAERRNGDFMRQLIHDGTATAVHDVSDGGIAVTLAEMALAGNIGVGFWEEDWAEPSHVFLFGEEQGRYVFTARIAGPDDAKALLNRAKEAEVEIAYLGTTGGEAWEFGSDDVWEQEDGTLERRQGWSVSLADLRTAHEAFFPNLMGSELAA
jgi:phosphoribosylformylglycinamidine synthase